MNVEKEARRDAREYARAQMYYGEGAGIRRRLIENTVQAKIDRNPKYHQAFRVELDKQDMAEHATKARRERRRKDTSAVVTKNTKALATGDYQNLQSGVLVVVVAGYFAHRAGLDRMVYNKAKDLKDKASAKIRRMRGKKQSVVHNIYNHSS